MWCVSGTQCIYNLIKFCGVCVHNVVLGACACVCVCVRALDYVLVVGRVVE